MNPNLLRFISAFPTLQVLVIGDAMLDNYLEGYTDRVSREAPVPVVTVQSYRPAPGGAANTAANVASLGGRVWFLSVVGNDSDGALLRQNLEERGVLTEHMIVHPDRRTLAKRRVMAASQMLLRFDEGSTGPVDAETEQRLVRRLKLLYPRVDVVVISDYGYGILTPRVIAAIRELQRRQPHVLVTDSKHLERYADAHVSAVKPNYGEVVHLLGIEKAETTCERADQIAAYREQILDLTGAQIAAVTLDSEGALIFERDTLPYRTYARPVPDSRAAGAGDTFVTALALALAAGADGPSAGEIASAAASIVVRRDGTTSCSLQELTENFSFQDKYAPDARLLLPRLEMYRHECKRVVFTNGCFDILHRGHITYLNRAKALGDVLVVAVNSDESVRRLKGAGRPINTLEDRIQVLSALSSVDHVVSFGEDTPAELIRLVRPDIFVKGGDYTRETLPEAPLVEMMGGSVKILPYIADRSTTGIIEKIREAYAPVPIAD